MSVQSGVEVVGADLGEELVGEFGGGAGIECGTRLEAAVNSTSPITSGSATTSGGG